jgi:cytosine/adenosine deaminase-related metal-dependent hydrolase
MAAAAAAVLICAVSLSSQATPYDVLIRNGRVLDGSGNPWLAADLGIRGGRIVDMGRLGNAAAARVIDARGLAVSPGFIDVHSHASQGLEGSLKEARQLLAQHAVYYCGNRQSQAYRQLYSGTLKAISNAGGRLLIPRAEMDRFLSRAAQYKARVRDSSERQQVVRSEAGGTTCQLI